jgi:hypothetical protein
MTHYRHTQVGWLMIGIVGVVAAITVSLVLGSDFTAALTFMTLAAALCALFGTMTVALDESRLTLWFGIGLIRKHIRFDEIRAYQAVRNPWYYGWGIRWFPGGWLYNISGFSAVELLLHNGRRVRVGTDEPDTLFAELQRVVGSRPPLTTAEVEAGRRRARLSVIVAVVLGLALILSAQCLARRTEPALSLRGAVTKYVKWGRTPFIFRPRKRRAARSQAYRRRSGIPS